MDLGWRASGRIEGFVVQEGKAAAASRNEDSFSGF
jgi:hypothetical protein